MSAVQIEVQAGWVRVASACLCSWFGVSVGMSSVSVLPMLAMCRLVNFQGQSRPKDSSCNKAGVWTNPADGRRWTLQRIRSVPFWELAMGMRMGRVRTVSHIQLHSKHVNKKLFNFWRGDKKDGLINPTEGQLFLHRISVKMLCLGFSGLLSCSVYSMPIPSCIIKKTKYYDNNK